MSRNIRLYMNIYTLVHPGGPTCELFNYLGCEREIFVGGAVVIFICVMLFSTLL